MPIVPLKHATPKIDPTAFIADGAHVIGDVTMGPKSSIWFGTVLRGDVDSITVGARTNIQDNSVVHVTEQEFPTVLEDDITVGHRVMLHGCHIKSRVLVGIGAILLDGVTVESDSMIAAGSLLTPGTRVPSGVLMMGAPAKPKRDLTPKEVEWILKSAKNYVSYVEMYV